MLLYLVNIIRVFMPLSLVTGLILALWSARNAGKAPRSIVISICTGLVAAVPVYLLSVQSQTITAVRVSLDAITIAAAIIHAGALFLPESRSKAFPWIRWGSALLFTAALALVVMFSFLDMMGEQALSSITVLNTELILNIGGILTGISLIAFLVPLTAHVSAKSGKGVTSGFLLVASILLVVPWCAEVLLGVMRLELAEVTSARLSFIAKVTQYAIVVPYALVFMIAVLSLVAFVKRSVPATDEQFSIQRADRRKARSRASFELRWLKSSLAAICAIVAILLSYDLYASRPPKISPPVRLTADAGGLIKIRIDDVKDGKLHRYSYVTDDGHVVRFILINRSKGQNRIGVVYDACMLCGDMGYIKQKNEVICIACNVRVFTPSIGKAGGCNPIPLKHTVEGEYVIVSAGELDKGAHYFSQVVSIRVKDPVTGKKLDNLKAPYRYEYKGRTYFFESEQSEEKFRASPEIYIGEQQSRYERVQGYQNQ